MRMPPPASLCSSPNMAWAPMTTASAPPSSARLGDLRRAMAEGVPVQGYIHWTLMDNYEWGAGIGHGAFGLASVDPVTFKRTPKPSSAVLGRIARSNAL
jgi:beta-glucosidase/6-phospho-beta-glucosidase/beta-galactosidase